MKSSSTSDSQFGLEMIPLDHSSSFTTKDLWQPAAVPIFDLNSTDPLPTIDPQITTPDDPATLPSTPLAEPVGSQDRIVTSGSVWIDGDCLMCACPQCQAPMSIRLWLMVADCWACQSSMELTEDLEREARQLWEQHHSVPLPGVERKPAPAPQKKTRQLVVPSAGPVPKPSVAQARIRQQTQLQGTEIWVTNFFKDTPAWLISLIFHVVLLTLLGLFEVHDDSKKTITLSLTESRFVREGGTLMESDPRDELTMDVPVPDDVDLEDPKQREVVMQDIQEAKELREDFDAKNPQLPNLRDVKKKIRDTNNTRSSLAARDPRVRVEMVKTEGGTTRTEAAVARGLRWLSQHQGPNGEWHLNHKLGSKGCKCSHPGRTYSDSAATSLALLPFLGAGQTHQVGKYKETVARGLKTLLDYQNSSGDLSHKSNGNSRMYAHGQGAIVLCEAYLLTGDEKLKKPAQDAINFIVKAQHRDGGWRYSPGQAGDTSVMGWQVMALHSARAAGLYVPDYTLRQAGAYLNRAEWQETGRYGYIPGQHPKHTMTAEGLLCRMYLGSNRNQHRLSKGVSYLAKNHPPNDSHLYLYYLYYASQVFHHMGGAQWDDWNFLMRETLVNSQETEGHAFGSWTPRASHDQAGGRLYMTSLSVCCLEVYYRHLPIFRQIKLD